MLLPIELISESMASFGGELLLAQDRPFQFRCIQMLPTDTSIELSDDILYVGATKTLCKLPKAKFKDHCFVFKAKVQQVERYRQFVNAIVLDENCEINDAINHLMKLFAFIEDIDRQLERAVIKDSGYEPIIEVARRMFPGSAFLMVDSAYNIIASTHKRVEDNEYVDGLIQQKFYDKRSLDRMAEMGYFDDGEKYLRPVLVNPPNICGCPVMLRSYHENGSFFSFVACYFFDHVPSLLEQQMFLLLTEQLDKYYKTSGFYEHSMPKRQQMLDDLINSRDASEEFVNDRCRGLRIPTSGAFRLGYIVLDSGHTLKASHLAMQLRSWCCVPNYGVFQYNNSVLVLLKDWHNFGTKEQISFMDQWQEMMEIISSSQGRIGVSLLFTSIHKLGTAFLQAETALSIGSNLSPNTNEYHYSEYCINDMLMCYRKKFNLEDVYVQYLDSLSGEAGGAYSNLQLLYYYISSERNISLTAKKAHMHRNSIIYRLRKIQDMLEIDLDDPDVRLRLMISFKILEMNGRLRLDGETKIAPVSSSAEKIRLME